MPACFSVFEQRLDALQKGNGSLCCLREICSLWSSCNFENTQVAYAQQRLLWFLTAKISRDLVLTEHVPASLSTWCCPGLPIHCVPRMTEHASTFQFQCVAGLLMGHSTQWLSMLQPMAAGAQNFHCCPWLLLVTAQSREWAFCGLSGTRQHRGGSSLMGRQKPRRGGWQEVWDWQQGVHEQELTERLILHVGWEGQAGINWMSRLGGWEQVPHWWEKETENRS